jgi:hypothetical protein
MKPEGAELRRQILTVAAEVRRREESRRERIETARRRIEGGSVAAGRKILEQAHEGDPAVQQLRREADHRMEDVDRLIGEAQQLFGDEQFGACAERLRQARTRDAHSSGLAKLEAKLCEKFGHRGTVVPSAG